MEAWPAVAWVLLMAGVTSWLRGVQCRDFSAMDIIMLHPSTTPHPGAFKCFTCQDAADNYECNRWAPDVYCPQGVSNCYGCSGGKPSLACWQWFQANPQFCCDKCYSDKDTKYCHTLHVMDTRGESVSVTKRCVALDDCLLAGCAEITDSGYRTCSSCCEGDICNMLVPRNESSAVFSSTSPFSGSAHLLRPAVLSYAAAIILPVVVCS